LKNYFASGTPLPSQFVQALVMTLYAVAVTTFASASQVSLPALNQWI
jgi:hypothetical protein